MSNFNEIKQVVFQANLDLKKHKLAILTWGNVSQITPDRQHVIIKPSGLDYSIMKAEDMVVVNMNGEIVEGILNPSSDTPTHIEIYKNFPNINSIVHTHSTYATSWAQAKKSIVALGTTHADTFYGKIPCTRELKQNEIENDYELNTGKVICETFVDQNYLACPGVLVASHGPFTWGKTCRQAVENAIILEEVAKIATMTSINTNHDLQTAPNFLQDKHYNRKHGTNAYYGQKKSN